MTTSTTSCARSGVPYRTPLPHCRCGNVIPRKDKNMGAVVCPKCAVKMQHDLRKHLDEGRIRFIEAPVVA